MKELIVKDNALINASYNLDLVEQRLILLAIMEARESGKGINANDPLTVHAESYINQFNVHRNTAYQALKDASKDLFARQFSYQEQRPKGIANITSRWVSQITYIDNTASVELIFSPAIIPLITRLEKHFTSYEMKQISYLSTGYAVRLYEILIAWRSIGKTPIIELTEFRKQIGVLDTEYNRMHDFKKRVLDPSIKQIKEHTDITVDIEQHKTGRFITGFSFKLKQKKSVNKQLEETLDINKVDLCSKMTDAQRHVFAHKLSGLPEMGQYSQGTESFPQFAIRIAEMLQNPDKFKELYPYLKKVGYMLANKKDTVNG